MLADFICSKEQESYVQDLEKQIFDLKQLLEISKSLNSTLNYNILMDSILYTVMGQLQVVKVGLLTKKSLTHNFFTLHRNVKGFDVPKDREVVISERGTLVSFLNENFQCFSFEDLIKMVPHSDEIKTLEKLNPDLIVPLKAKGEINGLIILGDRIDQEEYSTDEKDYLLNTALFASIAIHNAFLFEMSTTDMLTQLRMRHFFHAALIEHQERSMKENIPLSLIMMDIDHFKILNDTYGHTFGDEVLKGVTKSIREHVRQIDIAARYGGEEFVVLLPKTDLVEAHAVADRIRQEIGQLRFPHEGKRVSVTISLGVAQYDPRSDRDSESLINRADKALYKSKESGRNRVSLAH